MKIHGHQGLVALGDNESVSFHHCQPDRDPNAPCPLDKSPNKASKRTQGARDCCSAAGGVVVLVLHHSAGHPMRVFLGNCDSGGGVAG